MMNMTGCCWFSASLMIFEYLFIPNIWARNIILIHLNYFVKKFAILKKILTFALPKIKIK